MSPRNDPTRVLLAAHPTFGHTSALRAIGVRLREQGHDVAFCLGQVRLPCADRWPEPVQAAGRVPRAIVDDGLLLLPLRPVLSPLWYAVRASGKRGQDELRLAVGLFTSGMTRHARDIAAHARSWGAEIIVADYLMPAAMLGAQLAGLPFAPVYHSALPFPTRGAAPFGSGLVDDAPQGAEWSQAERTLQGLSEAFDRRVARAARRLGLPPPRPGLLNQPMSSDLNLLTTRPFLEPGLEPLEGPVVMTGPCLPRARRVETDHPALQALRGTGRRLYVSLGTVMNDQPEVFEAILDGVALGAEQVLVSAGASFARLAPRCGPQVHVFRDVPQVPLLAEVDLVVTHGGNNTVQECLAAGRPMVVIPFGGDQIANAGRVARLGAGVALMPSELSATRVRQALDAASQPACVERARALGARIAAVDGTGMAAEAVLSVVAARRDAADLSAELGTARRGDGSPVLAEATAL